MTISHSQFYTTNPIASLLIKCIESANVNCVLDLGAGAGSLSNAAHKVWKNAKIITADIDEFNCNILSRSGYYSNKVDCLLPGLNKQINIHYGTIDVCVCNPPYESVEYSKHLNSLLKKTKLSIGKKEKNTTTDLIFLAYNLLFLKPQGVLGIIVPYSIMAGKRFSKLRKSLMDNYYLEKVVELPERSFSYTEAKTGILIIRKEDNRNRNTKIYTVKKGFELSDFLTPTKEQLVERLDYSFYNWEKTRGKKENAANGEIKIFRGRYTHKDLKQKAHPYFHTTFFNRDDIDWTYKYDSTEKSVVDKGVFLIARVGKRCVGRVRYIETGRIQISDCIYAIKIPQEYVEDFKVFFNSREYSDFVKNNIRGVCSLYLCKSDLEDFLYQKLCDFRNKLW